MSAKSPFVVLSTANRARRTPRIIVSLIKAVLARFPARLQEVSALAVELSVTNEVSSLDGIILDVPSDMSIEESPSNVKRSRVVQIRPS